MEVQFIHNAIKGKLANSAIVSIVYEDIAGATMPFFNNIDIMNLPTIIHKDPKISYTGATFSAHMFT